MSTCIACIQGSHAILARLAGPHWLVSDSDAKAYAQAIANVARHYDIRTAQKTVDWINLAGMACFIEGTRLVVGRAQRQQQNAPAHARPRGPAQVFSFAPPPPHNGANPPPPPPASPQPGDDGTPPAAEGPFH